MQKLRHEQFLLALKRLDAFSYNSAASSKRDEPEKIDFMKPGAHLSSACFMASTPAFEATEFNSPSKSSSATSTDLASLADMCS